MKHCRNIITRSALILAAAGLVLSSPSLLAGDGTVYSGGNGGGSYSPPNSDEGLKSGVYISTDAGVNLLSKLKGTGDLSGAAISFDPGVRWNLDLGYAFKLADSFTLSVEAESGIIYNSMDKVSVNNFDGVTGSASVDGQYLQVPLLGNAVFNWEFAHNWILYAGGGVGGDFIFAHVSGSDLIGNDNDFAWQGLGGIKYKLGSADLGVGYKYLGVQPSGAKTQANNDILVSFAYHF